MKWLLKSPVPGDMIRVKVGDIYHYGIFAKEDEIIQFGPPPTSQRTLKNEEIKVISTDMADFLVGGELEVAELDESEVPCRTPLDIVAYARKNLGRGGYNILYNNCEHFANECVTGRAVSAQTDGLRAMFRSMPVVDIFTAEMPEDCKICELSPRERNAEIIAANNPRIKREKYCSWRLLRYALERSLGIKMENETFTKKQNGKWVSEGCYFSISHSGSLVAVAVSRAPVGIDVESHNAPIKERFADKILTGREHREYLSLPDSERRGYLISKWTEKEAEFKRTEEGCFTPGKIEIDKAELYSKTVEQGGERYTLSVATKTPERVRLYENIPTEEYI